MQEPDRTHCRVRIVEDELLIAMDLDSAVVELGYTTVGPAGSVTAALALLERDLPDAALLDETVGATSVAPVAARLADLDIPFVIVSGHVRSVSDNPILQTARRLEKPVTTKLLAEILSSLLRA
jgi:CheY-like chemotaxis protein